MASTICEDEYEHCVSHGQDPSSSSHTTILIKHEHFATPVKSGLVMDMDYDGPEIHTPTEYDKKPLTGKRSPVQQGIAQIKGVVKAISRRLGEQPTSLEILIPHKTRPGPYDTRECAAAKERGHERLREITARVESLQDTSVDARYAKECTRRLEGSLLQKANVREVELHIRPYARALEETQQAIRGLKGGLGVHDQHLKG